MARGRPRKIKPEEALETSMRMFWDKGYDGTSMNDIATATGVAKPGLYANFGDKDALFEKALTRYFDELGAPALNILANSSAPSREVLRDYLNMIVDAALDPSCPGGCFIVNSMVECNAHPKAMQDQLLRIDQRRQQAFATRMERAVQNGELPKNTDCRAMAVFFASMILSVALQARAGTKKETLLQIVETSLLVLGSEPVISRTHKIDVLVTG